MLKLVGKTTDGHLVVGGIYSLFETRGVPLSEIIAELWSRHGMVPDWVGLVFDQIVAGRKPARAIEAAIAAVRDSDCYPAALEAGVLRVLEHENFARFVAP